MVFQNYAIFPHLSVFENVAYGLKARNLSKQEIKRQVEEVLELVKMEEYIQRQPSKLSGGQQQRVALARAIVIKPEVLLMDEPLSNLDAKLRVEMRSVIKKIQQSLGITTIYVTHDQEEALAISDRMAVMNLGTIQQIGDPLTIYTRPKNTFVSNFIGTSTFLPCTVRESFIQVFDSSFAMNLERPFTGKAILAIRPEEVRMVEQKDGILQGEIQFVTFLGDFINYEVSLKDKTTLQVNEYIKDTPSIRKIRDKVGLTFDTARINLFTEDGEESLL